MLFFYSFIIPGSYQYFLGANVAEEKEANNSVQVSLGAKGLLDYGGSGRFIKKISIEDIIGGDNSQKKEIIEKINATIRRIPKDGTAVILLKISFIPGSPGA